MDDNSLAALTTAWIIAAGNLRASASLEPTMMDRAITESHVRRRALEVLAAGDALLAVVEAAGEYVAAFSGFQRVRSRDRDAYTAAFRRKENAWARLLALVDGARG